MQEVSKTGRPTEYSQETLEIARDYLETYETKHSRALPSIVGLARVLGISRSTVYEWKDDPDKSEFSDILEQILQEQHEVALTKGLKGEYNATLVKLLLGKHGYHDRLEHEVKGDTLLASIEKADKRTGRSRDNSRLRMEKN